MKVLITFIPGFLLQQKIGWLGWDSSVTHDNLTFLLLEYSGLCLRPFDLNETSKYQL